MELETQIPDCQKVARSLGFATFIDHQLEADDLVGSLVSLVVGAGWEAIVVSSDKDLCQLVEDRVAFLDFARGARLGPAAVETKMGVRPEQIPDYLGLAGDSVDNIPGVRGVGPKSAVTLLSHWPSLEALYGEVEAVRDLAVRGAASLAARLESGREAAFLSKRLATIVRDAPLEVRVADLELGAPGWQVLDDVCARLGFSTLPGRGPQAARLSSGPAADRLSRLLVLGRIRIDDAALEQLEGPTLFPGRHLHLDATDLTEGHGLLAKQA